MTKVNYNVSIESGWTAGIARWWVAHMANGVAQEGSGLCLSIGQTLPVCTITVVKGTTDTWSIFFLDDAGNLWGTGFGVDGNLSSGESTGTPVTLYLDGANTHIDLSLAGVRVTTLDLSSMSPVSAASLRSGAGATRRAPRKLRTSKPHGLIRPGR